MPYCSCVDLCSPFSDRILEVPPHGPGCREFCFGQGSVLLKGHSLPQPLLGGESRAHILLSLVLNPKHVCSAPLTLSDWRLGARTVDTSDQRLVHLPGYCCAELPKLCNDEWDLVSTLGSRSSGPTPWGSFYYKHLFLQNSLHIAMDATGPAIDVSNFGGGRCRTCR
jgi:hypothetical protein